MNYKKAKDILPPKLLEKVQDYVAGELIYIPAKCERAAWGSRSGARKQVAERNLEILALYKKGYTILELAAQFHLSEDSIKKIIYKK